MIPSWSAHYLNIPFVERGRSRYGVDCYGLVRMVYQEQRGIELPDYTEGYTTTTDTEEIEALCRNEVSSRWQEIPLAQVRTFDGIMFRIMGHQSHFALVLAAPYFLHSMQGIWSKIERYDSAAWQKRIVAAVRYVG